MNRRMQELLDRLSDSVFEDNFLELAEDCLDELSSMDGAFDAVEPLLRLMESNGEVDFGMPGPLVHFVERYFQNGYEPLLVDSVRRSPTRHTTWMLNRLINGTQGGERDALVAALREICENKNSESGTVDLAIDFLAMHNG